MGEQEMQWDKEAKAQVLIPTLPLCCVGLFPLLFLFLHLNQGFSTSALFMICTRSFLVEQCRMFSGILDLYPLDTSNTPTPFPSCDNQKCPPDTAKCPLRSKIIPGCPWWCPLCSLLPFRTAISRPCSILSLQRLWLGSGRTIFQSWACHLLDV